MASVFTLDVSGTLLALAFGVTIFYLGLQEWWFFIAVLIEFLVLSSLATRAREEEKMKLKGYEKVRSWKNVAANGLVPVLAVVVYFVYSSYLGTSLGHLNAILYAFVASVCAITADKFASEFGVLGSTAPIDIISGKAVRKGTSGGVTRFGTLMGLFASVLVGLTVFSIGASVLVFVVIVVSGVFGNLVDSALGHFEEKGIGNKYTSNLMCAASGAALCALILWIAL